MLRYDAAILREFPSIRAGVVRATGLANGPSPPALRAEYRAAQRAAAARLEDVAVADLPSIAAWRRALARFGVKPTQYRAAPEALLRRLAKAGDIPSINALADVANLVAVRHAMAVAAFDLAGVAGAIEVRFASGDERFTHLGSSDGARPEPGEVVLVDEAGVVAARRWCWRQSATGATGASTTDALFVVEGHHATAEADTAAALADLTGLLVAHQPGCSATARRISPPAGPTCPCG